VNCRSTYQPSRDPSLLYRCELEEGHSGKHISKNPDSSVIYSWPNSRDGQLDSSSFAAMENKNRPLNPAAVRATIDLISTVFAMLGLLIVVAGGVVIALYHAIGFAVVVIGVVFIIAGYRIWRRSLGI
jgi:hypothetical protein